MKLLFNILNKTQFALDTGNGLAYHNIELMFNISNTMKCHSAHRRVLAWEDGWGAWPQPLKSHLWKLAELFLIWKEGRTGESPTSVAPQGARHS